MVIHHRAWLEAHPERSEAWLRAKISEGFHVHHLDGNHGNNDPLNLALMDGADHMRLHNRPGFLPRSLVNKREAKAAALAAKAPVAYAAIAAGGYRKATAITGLPGYRLYELARQHATDHGLAWPIRKTTISGPLSVAVEMMLNGALPPDGIP